MRSHIVLVTFNDRSNYRGSSPPTKSYAYRTDLDAALLCGG